MDSHSSFFIALKSETYQPNSMPAPLRLTLQGLSKSFPREGGRLEVLRALSLEVLAGSFVAILGPSGSGKSTLLSIIAGLDEPDRGTISLFPQDASVPLDRRLGQVGYMPQRDLLLPWRTALDNAIVALQVGGIGKQEARRRAMPLLEQFGLAGFANNYPHELSGGMRQRVSFLRSAMTGRGLMLLDEPFGGLDALTRGSMQEWLMVAAARLGSTFVLVTHDIDEAVLMADRVYVLSPRPGRVLATLDVELPRPRQLESTGTPLFANYRSSLLETLRSAGSLARVETVAR
ncbi:MAG: ABC transporter ATP-binding protein [Chloroflexota bacterium]|nr:ABC transporter ATP-binding protein [Chloroflexota bacterium]